MTISMHVALVSVCNSVFVCVHVFLCRILLFGRRIVAWNYTNNPAMWSRAVAVDDCRGHGAQKLVSSNRRCSIGHCGCSRIFVRQSGLNEYEPGFSGVVAASTSVGAAVSSAVVVVLCCTQKLGTNSVAFTFNVENFVDMSVSFSWAIFVQENILKRVLYKKLTISLITTVIFFCGKFTKFSHAFLFGTSVKMATYVADRAQVLPVYQDPSLSRSHTQHTYTRRSPLSHTYVYSAALTQTYAHSMQVHDGTCVHVLMPQTRRDTERSIWATFFYFLGLWTTHS